uniref:ADP,ATP carrier protein n=1 Tax=Panagrellus redivivus TaxID=6233 RepID=A0A7E4V153_PANRE
MGVAPPLPASVKRPDLAVLLKDATFKDAWQQIQVSPSYEAYAIMNKAIFIVISAIGVVMLTSTQYADLAGIYTPAAVYFFITLASLFPLSFFSTMILSLLTVFPAVVATGLRKPAKVTVESEIIASTLYITCIGCCGAFVYECYNLHLLDLRKHLLAAPSKADFILKRANLAKIIKNAGISLNIVCFLSTLNVLLLRNYEFIIPSVSWPLILTIYIFMFFTMYLSVKFFWALYCAVKASKVGQKPTSLLQIV